MSERDLARLLRELLGDDEQLYARLCAEGLVPRDDAALSVEHLETARVVRTLVHELEINWPGVEVILRMRSELVETRRQVSSLAQLLREQQERGPAK